MTQRTRVVTISIGWGIVLVVVIIVGTIWVVNHATSRPAPVTIPSTQPTWPPITRTIDGTPTVVQPEDLDRNTS